MIKIATWNINSIKVRLDHVLDWLKNNNPDVLALQELKSTDEKFPVAEFKAAGYHAIFSGQKTYNGVAILSKECAVDIVKDISSLDDPQRRILAATVQGIRLLNLYIPNGQQVDSEKYRYKLSWLEKVYAYIAAEKSKYQLFIILGDFNIAPEDIDVHDPALWEGKVLFSEPERQFFKKMLDMGFKDCFRLIENGQYFSWWDYRQASFRRNLGLRIDHILVSDALAKQCIHCCIDTEPRKWQRPSDHAPLIAQFDLAGA